MKKLSLFVIILSSILFSCEKEDIQNNLGQENLRLNRSLDGPTPNIDNFSLSLDWATYVVGDILQNNHDLKEFAKSQLDQTTQTIHISSLLGANNPESVLFRERFRQRFILFNACSQNRNNDGFACPGGKDIPDPIGCSSCLISGVFTNEDVDILLDYLILENCVEFYFPKGIIIDNGTIFPESVTSVVHPFSNANTNKGYQHNAAGVRSVAKVNDLYTTLIHKTVIVGRPIRTSEDQCAYTQYDVDSFITYLEGPF